MGIEGKGMMAPNQLDYRSFTEAICEGIVRGNAGVLAEFVRATEKRHSLRNMVEGSVNKTYELDKEMVLVKGVLMSLVGSDNDGSSGLVTRMDHDMQDLKKDMITVKNEVSDLTENVGKISKTVEKILDVQSRQTSWMDGWKGVGVAIGLGATCVTIIGGVIAALLWLYQHGMPSVGQHTSIF